MTYLGDPQVQALQAELAKAREQLAKEKQRRVYYQDIVYAVCNILDIRYGVRTVCGSIEDKSTAVQDLVTGLLTSSFAAGYDYAFESVMNDCAMVMKTPRGRIKSEFWRGVTAGARHALHVRNPLTTICKGKWDGV